MYSNSEFTSTALSRGITAVDEADGRTYRFSKRGVRRVRRRRAPRRKKAYVRWNTYTDAGGAARSYQIKLYNNTNGRLLRTIRGVTKKKKTLKGLRAGRTYTVLVRARRNNDRTGNARFSAWSEPYVFTTRD